MLTDAADLDAGSELRADVCIIGAGAAGIILARALAARKRSVLLLESGGFEREEATQALYDGRYKATVVRRKWPTYMSWSRLRYFGGSTGHWAGYIRPLDAIDFEARPWVPDSGWPFDQATLAPYYRAATPLIQISQFPEFGGQPYTGPDFFSETDEIGDTPYFFSPPTRFGKRYRKDLVGSPQVQLVLHANALGFETRPGGQAIDHVRFRALGRPESKARATLYVLATGGLENPRLLMHSGNVERGGLGNEHDLVGRYFMDHPHLTTGVVVATQGLEQLDRYRRGKDRKRGHDILPVLAPTPKAMRAHRLPNCGAEVRWHMKPPNEVDDLVELSGLGEGSASPSENSAVTLFTRFEQYPNRSSRVVLTDDVDALGMRRLYLDWRLSDDERGGVFRAMHLFASWMGRSKLGRLRTRVEPAVRWPTGSGGCHHMGTTRMSADPKKGVVDADCRMHAVDDLYVAGSSVFPTGGFANPTYTILALTLRLADHLDRRLAR